MTTRITREMFAVPLCCQFTYNVSILFDELRKAIEKLRVVECHLMIGRVEGFGSFAESRITLCYLSSTGKRCTTISKELIYRSEPCLLMLKTGKSISRLTKGMI
jgi:hypothetical protein